MSSSPRPQQDKHDIATSTTGNSDLGAGQAAGSSRPVSGSNNVTNPALVTERFRHVVTEEGHSIATGSDGEKLLRCEDEPIHIPGAVQGFGLLIALDHQELLVRIVSENSQAILGYTPEQLFSLRNFTSIFPEDQASGFMDHLAFVRDDADVASNGPEVFSLSVYSPTQNELKLWCAIHINDQHPHLVICEFELEDDHTRPLVPPSSDLNAEPVESTLGSEPTADDWSASTQSKSKPLRFLRGVRRQPSMALAAMDVTQVITQVQDQLGAQSTLQNLLDVLVGLVQDLTGFHRTMVYQFDRAWNGRVVAELLNPRTTKDLYKGLHFPAGDIPKQARDLYRINKVRLLYDRDQETARLVCRTKEDLSPLDLTHSYLRAMSPVHSQYLRNMAVRSSLSVSITAFGELWGLIACHSYGSKGIRTPFPTRNICRFIGDATSRNIERLSYTARLQMRAIINSVPTKQNPSGYIAATSEDLLRLLNASFGLLTIRDETKMLGSLRETEKSKEMFTILKYLRKKSFTEVTASTKIEKDFPDLHYPPGFQIVAGLLLVPLSSKGQDFIVFFRRSQATEVKWAGNPYEKDTKGHLMPTTSFKAWSQTVTGSKQWTEEEFESAAVLRLVYGKFIEIWRQKVAALQNSQFTRVLLANSAHEVRTPLNAIINYLEIALEGKLDSETRDNLAKSHSASKSLIYVINDLLDLTTAEGRDDLAQNETFDLRSILQQATDWFSKDARRKQILYNVSMPSDPPLPTTVIGDARRLRQAISNIIANAIENTATGEVRIDVASTSLHAGKVEIEICVSDTGVGMNAQTIDALSRELLPMGSERSGALEGITATARKVLADSANPGKEHTLGLGLAVVSRIVHNMCGQLRLKSEEGRGSRFVLVFPFDLPNPGLAQQEAGSEYNTALANPERKSSDGLQSKTGTSWDMKGEITLIGSSGRDVSHKNTAGSSDNHSTTGYVSDTHPENSINRLIEEFQKPNGIGGWQEPGVSNDALASRAIPDQERTAHGAESWESEGPSKDLQQTTNTSLGAQRFLPRPGTVNSEAQGQPSRASRVPDEIESSAIDASSDAPGAPREIKDDPSNTARPSSPAKMRVLVAEDELVNSRIIEKRLKKVGHEVFLTKNGEECACTFREEKGCFDIVLMDIQMPIMDGYASTKSIRSFERTHHSNLVSQSGSDSPKSHVPIIAVSASLVEKERDFYIDVGFDGWILKPIAFDRLQHIISGVADPVPRKEDLWQLGSWERGGWFNSAQHDIRLEEGPEESEEKDEGD